MKKVMLLLCLLLMIAANAAAADIRFNSALNQGDFNKLSKEAGVALSFKNNAPPHPLGVTGFDAGVEVTVADVNNDGTYWKAANAPSMLVLPKIRARKGLPFGIDVGAMYSNGGNTNIQLYGVEVSKAILEGSAATPALGVRATYTKLAGINDLDLQTVGVDASIGKGFLFLTPYAGAGMLWIDSKASGNLKTLSATAGAPLATESIWQPRFFGGVEIKPIPLVRVVAEVEYALRPVYSLKAAVGF